MGRDRIEVAEGIRQDVLRAAELDESNVSKSDLKEIRIRQLAEEIVAIEESQDPTDTPQLLLDFHRKLNLPGHIERIVFTPHRGFRFQELPAEMRSDIYGLVLTDPYTIPIHTYRKRGTPKDTLSRVVVGENYRNNFRKPKNHLYRQYNRQTGKWIDNPESFASILLTSKEVYREAAAVLCGDNTFLLSSQNAVKCFIGTLAEQRDSESLLAQPSIKLGYKCLTTVDLGFPSLQGLKQMLKYLEVANNLRDLYLDVGFFEKPTPSREGKEKGTARLWRSDDVLDRATAFYRTVIPFLCALEASDRPTAPQWTVLDIIKNSGYAKINPSHYKVRPYKAMPRKKPASLHELAEARALADARVREAKEMLIAAEETRRSKVASLDSFMTRFHQLAKADLRKEPIALEEMRFEE